MSSPGWIAVGVNFANPSPIVIITSASDASSWTDKSAAAVSAYAAAELHGVAYSSTLNRWVAAGYDSSDAKTPVVIYSNDGGSTWILASLPSFGTNGFQILSICWDGSTFIASGVDATHASPRGMSSSDGITWAAHNPASGIVWGNAVSATSSLAVMAGSAAGSPPATNDIVTSADHGSTWTSRASPANITQFNGVITVSGGRHVAVGFPDVDTHSGIATSTDGSTWTTISSGFPTNHSYYDVAWNGSIYAAVGSDFDTDFQGSASSSPDGLAWTNRTTAPSGPINTFDGPNFLSIAPLNLSGGGFVAVGRDNNSFTIPYIMYSADGITWVARTGPIASGNGILNGVGAGQVGAKIVGSPPSPKHIGDKRRRVPINVLRSLLRNAQSPWTSELAKCDQCGGELQYLGGDDYYCGPCDERIQAIKAQKADEDYIDQRSKLKIPRCIMDVPCDCGELCEDETRYGWLVGKG